MTAMPCTQRTIRQLAALAVVFGVVAMGSGAAGRLVVAEPADPGDPEASLDRIEDAVRTSDHRALADLVSSDGVRLSLGPVADRTSVLTPSQAFYYFKSLFQNRRTETFAFEKHQEVEGGRLHALASWHFTSLDGGGAQRQRMLFTLERGTGGWKVCEITAWR